MKIKNIFKCATMGIILSVFTMTTTNATIPELLVEDGYASLNKYVFFSSATLEKRVVDLKDESLSKYKYIVVLNSTEKDKKNIIEIFENGAGAYINGQYIPFESVKVTGFSVPSRSSIKEKNSEVYLPTSFFVDYLGSQILEEGKLSVDKLPQIQEGIVGEFNDLSNVTTNKISNSNSEKIEDKLDDNTTNNNVNNNTNGSINNQGSSGNSSMSQGGNSNNSNTGSNNNSSLAGNGNSNQGSNNNNSSNNNGSNNTGNSGSNNSASNGSNNTGNSGNNSSNSGNNTNNGGNDNINDSNNNGNNVNEGSNTSGNQENENSGQTDGTENNQSNSQGVSQDKITEAE